MGKVRLQVEKQCPQATQSGLCSTGRPRANVPPRWGFVQLTLPELERWVRRGSGHILKYVLSGSMFGPFRIDDVARIVQFDDVGKDGIGRLKRTGFLKNARVIDALKQR